MHESRLSLNAAELTARLSGPYGVLNGLDSAETDVHESFSWAYGTWMSTKHIRTAADLVRFKAWLKITCTECGNSRTVDGYAILRASEHSDLRKLHTKLKCSLCGAKDPKVATIVPPSRN